MATQSGSSSTGIGSTTQPIIVEVLETSRNPSIWCNFNLVRLSDNSTKAHCKHCGHFLSAASNSTLKTHTEKYCEPLKATPREGQASVARDGTIFSYSAERCRQEFACFVIQDTLPFNHFDNPRLTRVIQNTLQPRYNQVSRHTLKRECMKIWKKAKQELVKGFENLNVNVNLTTDVWSAPHGLPGSYLCVTAHWVDPNTWQMMKRTIAFENFEYPHTARNLFYILRDVINYFKLQQKVFSIAFDNASNNNLAVKHLILKFQPPMEGIFYHMRCVAHIINLVVQDGLGVMEINSAKNNFKNMLQDIFCCGKGRYKSYMRLCKETDKPFLTPNWDVPTRWNSTYKMFLCGLRQKETLQIFHDDLYSRGKVRNNFSSDDWEIIKKLTDFLKVFKTATTLLSGVYYPTIHHVLKSIFLMCETLSDFEFKGPLYEKMVRPMKQKLKKYFQEMPPAITCAAALNPCLNSSGVEIMIEKICFDLELHEDDVMFSRNAIISFNSYFQELFQVYFNKYGSRNDGASSSSSSFFNVTHSSDDPMMSLYNSLRMENNKRARGEGNANSSEFGRYTGTDFLATMGPDDFKDFDILAWWKARESQFPVLAAMAKDLLTVQASTVASESCFSTSGRVLSIRRTRLTPASLEMCICLKDHLDAAERIQDKTSLEGELDIEQELHDIEVEEGVSISLSDEEIALDEASRNASSDDDLQLENI